MIHRDTDRRIVFKFREIWRTKIGKNRAYGARSKVNAIFGWSRASTSSRIM